MQAISVNSQIMSQNLNEVFLDTLFPNELLKIIFDQIVNQSQPLCDISSLLITCKKWKNILEENSCISLVQALFKLKDNDRSAIILPQECLRTEQKQRFTPYELKLIDRAHQEKKFENLLMVNSNLFHLNSLFLSLLDHYSWDPEICKKSANKNIQYVAKEQLSILSSLASGTDDQQLTIIKNDFIEKLYSSCRGQLWEQAKTSVISTLKKVLINDNKIFIKAASCFGSSVFDIDESFKKDREIVLAAVQKEGKILQLVDERFKKDREIVWAAVNQYGWALQYADESLKKDREIVWAAVQQVGWALQYADESFKKDRQIVLAAVKQDGFSLQYADECLKKDRELVLAAVRETGWSLRYGDENLKKDLEIIMTAVKQTGGAFQYVNASLKKDREFVLTVVQQNGAVLQFVEESFKKDREIVLAAVKQDGMALQFAYGSFKKDQEIVLTAIKQRGGALKYAHESLKKALKKNKRLS